jgi:hypothetical protein
MTHVLFGFGVTSVTGPPVVGRDADRLILHCSEADAKVCRSKIRLQAVCFKCGLGQGRHISVVCEG